MKKVILILLAILFSSVSCKTTKPNTEVVRETDSTALLSLKHQIKEKDSLLVSANLKITNLSVENSNFKQHTSIFVTNFDTSKPKDSATNQHPISQTIEYNSDTQSEKTISTFKQEIEDWKAKYVCEKDRSDSLDLRLKVIGTVKPAKVVEMNKLNGWQKGCVWYTIISLVAAIIFLLVKYRKLFSSLINKIIVVVRKFIFKV